MKQWVIGALIFAVLILSYWWNRSNVLEQKADVATEKLAEEILVRDDGSVVKKTGSKIEVMTDEEAAAKKKEIEEKLASDTVKTVALTSENSYTLASGSSKRVFIDGVYFQEVKVSGLEPAGKGFFYEAWLRKADGSTVSIGRLDMEDSKGMLLYSSKEDRSGYTTLLISKEVDNGDMGLGEVVLKGEFTDK